MKITKEEKHNGFIDSKLESENGRKIQAIDFLDSGSLDISQHKMYDVRFYVSYLKSCKKWVVSIEGKDENGKSIEFSMFTELKPVLSGELFSVFEGD